MRDISSLVLLCGSLLMSSPGFGQTSISSGTFQRTVEVGNFAGADLGAKLRAADVALGSEHGTLRVSSPGRLTTPVTLSIGHALQIAAPVSWGATVALSGGNDVGCAGQGTISATMPVTIPLLSASGVAQLSIHDCPVSFAANSPVLLADGIHQVTMSHLNVTGGSLAQINGAHGNDSGGAAGEMSFTNNVVRDAPNTGGAALLLVNTTGAKIENNRFDGISTGTQWWGGDSANGNIAEVNRTGKMTLTGNQCHGVTACLWGSMGYGITVAHNQADGCSDVCFDTEGGLDTVFESNVATNCGNGCGAIFFFSKNVTFRANVFSADARGGGLIFIKNRSADPRSHTGFVVSGNKLTCVTICNAFLQEAVSQATFQSNVITNGVFATVGFGQQIAILENQFTFTRALGAGAAVINGPSITGGTSLTIQGNIVTSSVPQGADSKCINAIWNDFNNVDAYFIRKNRCEGSSPFPVAIATNTAGANPGPHADWHIEENFLGGGRIVHLKTTSNETYTARDNCAQPSCAKP